MKNITVTVDDEMYERSRILAAQRKTTLTGLVRDFLRSLSDADEKREQARQELLKLVGSFGGEVGKMPPRQERYGRP